MALAERLSTASSHSTPAATRFTLSTGEYSSCTHTHIGACTAASQHEGPGFDSRMGRCWYWGQVLLQCSGGLSSGPFCVEFACSPRVHKGFLHLEPQQKTHAKEQITLLSVPDKRWTVHFTAFPGATSCPLLLGGPGGGTFRDGKRQRINSPRPQACVCVCVRPQACVCVCVCVL